MKGYLLDTNCVSELVRLQPERRVLEWLDGIEEELLHLSVLTLGEIRKGVASLPQGRRRAQLESWLEGKLPQRFAGRLLAVDERVANRWGVIAASARRKGLSLPVIDGLLAATALCHGLTMVSRNASDFAATDVPVLNPWDAA